MTIHNKFLKYRQNGSTQTNGAGICLYLDLLCWQTVEVDSCSRVFDVKQQLLSKFDLVSAAMEYGLFFALRDRGLQNAPHIANKCVCPFTAMKTKISGYYCDITIGLLLHKSIKLKGFIFEFFLLGIFQICMTHCLAFWLLPFIRKYLIILLRIREICIYLRWNHFSRFKVNNLLNYCDSYRLPVRIVHFSCIYCFWSLFCNGLISLNKITF